MNQQETQGSGERCLCREVMDQLKDSFGVSPSVRQHLNNSRIEFLKAIREVLNDRIERLASRHPAQQGTKVSVE